MRAAGIGRWAAAWALAAVGQTSVPIHVTIVMHSEQSVHYESSTSLFESNRTNLYLFASMLASKGVQFDFQSDWTFLTAVTNFDRAGRAETGGTNIVAWLHHTLGFEVDPHTHIGQTAYNYADDAALLAQCGVTPTEVVGGFIASPASNSQWALLQQPVTGAVYTSAVWTPGVLWGGASGSHVDETNLWFSGIFSPRDETHYFEHEEGHLPLVGGFGGKDVIWTNLDLLLACRAAGGLCPDRLYTCNLMTDLSSLSPAFTLAFAARLQAYTNTPNLRWVNLSQLTNIWATEYAQQASCLPYVMTNDMDADGLVDGWEVTNFCSVTASDGTSDADGDGQADAHEYVAGTSPVNAADLFRLLAIDTDRLSWSAVPGRRYVVETDAGAGWAPAYTVTSFSAVGHWTNLPSTTAAWHRVLVGLP